MTSGSSHSQPPRLTRQLNFLFRVFFTFLLRYRRTALGPLWTLAGPILFIGTLSFLYAHIGNRDLRAFMPHIAIGFITWSLIQHMINDAVGVYRRGRANILQGQLPLDDLVMLDVMTNVLIFLHQCLVIAAVLILCGVQLTPYALFSLVGVTLIVLNGVWVMRLLGLVGARYRDLSEIVPAAMRIAFLASPIIWMPDRGGGRSALFTAFLTYNPFYHFLDVVRAPLLGHTVEPLSWIVVISITVLGFIVEGIMTARYARFVPLWV